ncbi:MAG: hypothetical protein KTR14_10530 [Vampirovibrio sp.]|nr:hypothetical protein [Vampirovibrio sp.]
MPPRWMKELNTIDNGSLVSYTLSRLEEAEDLMLNQNYQLGLLEIRQSAQALAQLEQRSSFQNVRNDLR